MMPSTCGITTAESRDLSVATYSVVSSTFWSAAVFTLTGIACGPPAFAAPLFPHAEVIMVANAMIPKPSDSTANRDFRENSTILWTITVSNKVIDSSLMRKAPKELPRPLTSARLFCYETEPQLCQRQQCQHPPRGARSHLAR